MTTRKYTSRSQQTTLTSAVTSGATSVAVVSVTTLLGGATVTSPETFTVVIDPDTALEEVVDVTATSGGTILSITRAIDGSSGQDHSAGAVVRHMVIGRDLREANLHAESSSNYVVDSGAHSLHGLNSGDGVVVGSTQSIALTNKTISGTSNTITNIASGSLPSDTVYKDVTQTLTAKTLTSPTINSGTINTPTIAGATISGTFTSTATITGGTVNPTTLQQGGVQVLTTSNTATVTNKTLTSPTINGGTVSSATVTSATIASGTLSTDLAAGGFKVTGLGTPTASSDSATKNYVDTSISNLVASAPSTLDTLNELAAALGNDASFSTTITTSIATKLPKSGGTMTGAIDMGSSKITNLGTPTVSSDAVTKNYIDTLYGSTVAAATSAASAATSASSAATSASSALTSQSAAATSATSAAASATAAATSATSAAASATAAATSASSALTSQTAAATSATSAAASATAAATSAASALTSQTYSGTYATNAATSASSALASQTAAATSAASAATSASSAATSASSSLTTYNTYKTYYLGTFSTAPTLDNQGNALITGATYFNSVSNVMYVYTGSIWSAISSATSYSPPTLGSTTIASGTTYATLTGLNLTNGTVTADPTTNLGIASKQYVDGVAAGLNTHDSVQAATTSAITVTYTAGSAGADGGTGVGAYMTVTATGVLVVDGYTTVLNDRILIKNQASATQNGIYKVTTAGASGVSAVLTRATDYDNSISGEVFAGDIVFVIGGTKNINQGWVMNATGTSTSPAKGIKINTDNIAWTQFTGASLVTAGNGLSKSGDTLSIDTTITADLTTAQTLSSKTISGGTLTGSLTANSTSGTTGQFLQTTGTGVQWATASTYAAPTLGATVLTSGSTIASVADLILTSSVVGNVSITVKGIATQSADLQQWQNSAGTILSGFNAAGQIYAGTTASKVGSTTTALTSAAYTSATVAVFTYGGTSLVQAGQTVTVAGVTGGTYNGTWVVSAVTSTTFTVLGSGFTNVAGTGGTFKLSAVASIVTPTAATPGLVIQRGSSSQTTSLLEIQDETGGYVVRYNQFGNLTHNGSAVFQNSMTVTPNAAGNIGLIVKGAASQTADFINITNSSNTSVAKITSAGNIISPAHMSLDGNGIAVDIALMNIMGAW